MKEDTTDSEPERRIRWRGVWYGTLISALVLALAFPIFDYLLWGAAWTGNFGYLFGLFLVVVFLVAGSYWIALRLAR